MNKGILYVAFGENYTTPLKTSIEYLRKVSNLPICVITNQQTLPIDVEQIIYLNMDTNQNRVIRTTAIKYTPFEQTLMMDSDSIPISAKINILFDGLNTHDFGFQKAKEYTDKISKIYAHALYKTQLTTPITAYSGGVLLFNNSLRCHEFFDRWHEYWKLIDVGRDMQALACTIKKMSDQIKFFTVDHCIDREINGDTILFHGYGHHDKTIIPKFDKNKPFDNRNNFWELISIEPNVLLNCSPLENSNGS